MVIHFSRIKKHNAFRGTTTGTLCNRFRIIRDGMNIETDQAKVTCKLCLAKLAIQKAKEVL
jgi:hypothetical protein